VLLALVMASAACEDKRDCGEAPCGPSIALVVTDALSGQPLADSAFAYARDGDYVDTLDAVGDRTLEGVVCRPGVFEVHLERPGYQSWDTSGVDVADGPCLPFAVRIDVALVGESR
jgi:hypothetical protein